MPGSSLSIAGPNIVLNTIVAETLFQFADILEKRGIGNVSLVCFDLTDNNKRCISKGTISAVICQRPELQGFYAVSGLIRNLLYNQEDGQKEHLMPIDIIIAENLPYYKEYLP